MSATVDDAGVGGGGIVRPGARVCPECGKPGGVTAFCGNCGLNLSAVDRLPTRKEWEAGETSGRGAPASARTTQATTAYPAHTPKPTVAARPSTAVSSRRPNPAVLVAGCVALVAAVLIVIGSFLRVHTLGLDTGAIPSNSFVADGDWWVLVAGVVAGVAALNALFGVPKNSVAPLLIA
jgi:hypothetical protein